MGIHYGEVLLTADATNLRVFQPLISESDISVIAFRTWLIFYNDPVFTSLSMDIYTDNGSDSPGVLYASSTNSILKSEIMTEANAVKSMNFNFNNLNFKANEIYNALIRISGYTGTNSSHIAWYKSFDPVYNDPTATLNEISTTPYHISALIGAKF